MHTKTNNAPKRSLYQDAVHINNFPFLCWRLCVYIRGPYGAVCVSLHLPILSSMLLQVKSWHLFIQQPLHLIVIPSIYRFVNNIYLAHAFSPKLRLLHHHCCSNSLNYTPPTEFSFLFVIHDVILFSFTCHFVPGEPGCIIYYDFYFAKAT